MVIRVVPQESDRPAQTFSQPDASSAESPSPSTALLPVRREGPTTRSDAGIRFYTIEEVDQPAHPRLDWVLPLDSIAASGLRRLVIQIWILDTGEILDVDIISATPVVLGEQDKRNIVTWLRQTQVAPAIRGRQRVASQRTLEIAFEL